MIRPDLRIVRNLRELHPSDKKMIEGDWVEIRAMPSARAATPSGPSLLRVSGAAGIAIAVFCVVYFGGRLLLAVVS